MRTRTTYPLRQGQKTPRFHNLCDRRQQHKGGGLRRPPASGIGPIRPRPALVSVSLGGLTISNVYLHPNLDLALDAWRQLRAFTPEGPQVVVGDFNTHHPDWDPRARPNPRGDMLRAWISSRGLYILNPPGPSHNAGGVIDLALGPARSYAEFAHWASDHRALLVSIPHRPPQPLPPPKRLPRSGYNEAMQLLRALLPPPPQRFESREQLDAYAWDVFDALTGVVGRFAV